MNSSFNKSAFFSAITTILILSFVVPVLGDSKVSKGEREKAVSTLDNFYAKYLVATLTEARSNLQKAVAFIDENRSQIPELQSALPICFARLSLLERKGGNEAQARLYFAKSQYWRIVEREKIGLKPEEILADHDAFTREESDKYVLEWDKKRTKGEGPAYLKSLEEQSGPKSGQNPF